MIINFSTVRRTEESSEGAVRRVQRWIFMLSNQTRTIKRLFDHIPYTLASKRCISIRESHICGLIRLVVTTNYFPVQQPETLQSFIKQTFSCRMYCIFKGNEPHGGARHTSLLPTMARAIPSQSTTCCTTLYIQMLLLGRLFCMQG